MSIITGTIIIISKIKEDREFNTIDIMMNLDIEYVKNILDNMIEDALARYTIFNIGNDMYRYITEEEQKEITKFIIKDVVSNITPSMRSLLNLVYNIKTQEDLVNVIYDKSQIYVLELSIKQNAIIDDDGNKENIKLESQTR